MATLIAVRFEGAAVAFAAPAGAVDALRRLGLGDTGVKAGRIWSLGNPYDPVFAAGDRCDRLVGEGCAWDAEEPGVCEPCLRDVAACNAGGANATECRSCFAETHIFAKYLELLEAAPIRRCDVHPWPRPR